ncbi:MAG: hypothetical protein H6672_09865 [Anaerolineaceae bacterium]|nr:hypothetical protein [Anaerolineaceae bacterium]
MAGLLYTLRRLQVWLHQHIFKVGWLVLKNYETTTILYYAFFLPGVFLYELSYWFAAGLLNVRADRAIAWPERQEIGELKLSFVNLAPKTSPFRIAIITLIPFLTGLLIVSLIANSILNVQEFLSLLNNGYLTDVSAAINQFTSAQDFWLWLYITFTISNTSMPSMNDLRGLRGVLITVAVIAGILFVLGIGNEAVVAFLAGTATDALNNLAGVLAVIIGIDIFMVAVLGTIEAVIERITGDSATFKNGKMVTMRRAEMLEERAKERDRATRRSKTSPAPQLTIYQFPLPVPGPPGREAPTPAFEITPEQAALPGTSAAIRNAPAVISGSVSDKPTSSSTTSAQPFASPFASSPDDGDEEAENEVS